MSGTPHTRELPPPSAVEDDSDAREIVRLWVAGRESHISLDASAFDSRQEAKVWGLVLADIATQAIEDMIARNPDVGTRHGLRKTIVDTCRQRLSRTLDETRIAIRERDAKLKKKESGQ